MILMRMWQLRRRSRRIAVLAAAVLCQGCIDGEEVAAIHRRDSQFAEEFIRDLHAGGLPSVHSRIKPATLRDANNIEGSFSTMRGALPAGPIDSLRPLDADIELDGRLTVSKLAYRVYGGTQAALVVLWIETTPTAQYVETVSVSNITPEVWPATAAQK